jgi:hypothetical protein
MKAAAETTLPCCAKQSVTIKLRHYQPGRSLKGAAEKAASDDNRSLTSIVEKLLADHLRKKGYLPKT